MRLLEERTYGHSLPSAGVPLLVRCYLDAHRVLRVWEPASAVLWVAQAYLWDVRTFVVLGRHLRDPYPFRPLLAAVDLCVLHGIPGAEAACAHLESVSQDLLRAQGLGLVEPRDVMVTLRLGEALTRLSTDPRAVLSQK